MNVDSSDECLIEGGDFFPEAECPSGGAGDPCEVCNCPIGACCFNGFEGDSTCQVLTLWECNGFSSGNGTWLGEGTVCDPNPCGSKRACCATDGSFACLDMTTEECNAIGGRRWTGHTCTDAQCGSCCSNFVDGPTGMPYCDQPCFFSSGLGCEVPESVCEQIHDGGDYYFAIGVSCLDTVGMQAQGIECGGICCSRSTMTNTSYCDDIPMGDPTDSNYVLPSVLCEEICLNDGTRTGCEYHNGRSCNVSGAMC